MNILPTLRLLTVVLLFGLGSVWAQVEELQLEPLTAHVDVLPRQTLTLLLRVTNTGNAVRTVQPQLELPPGWRLLLPPETLSLPPGEARTALFTLLVSAEATAGDYILPVLLEEGGVISATGAAFSAQVQRVDGLEAALLEAPGFVLAEPYTLRFVVRNTGNSAHDVGLTASANPAMPVGVEPRSVRLEAGASQEVLVRVAVPASLASSASQRVRLTAQSMSAVALQATAQASVDLIPRRLSAAAGLHTFPLLVEGSWRLEQGFGRGAPNLEVSGSGRLWDEDPGRLSLSYRPQSKLVEYLHPDFRVSAGERRFSLSPLSPAEDGTGLELEASMAPLRLRLLGYRRGGDRLGLQATAFGEHADASLNVFWQPELPGPLLGGSARYFPDLSPGQQVTFDLEVGAQLGAAHGLPGALRLGGSAAAGPFSLSLGWQGVQAGYRASVHDESTLTAASTLRLAQEPRLSVSSRWLERVAHDPNAGGRVASYYLSSGATLNGALGSTTLSLLYDYEKDMNLGADRDRNRHDLAFRFSLALAARLTLQQSLAWQGRSQTSSSQTDSSQTGSQPGSQSGTRSDSLSYGAGLQVPYAGGSVSPSLRLGYDLQGSAISRIDLGLGWSGQIAGALDLRLNSELYLWGNERLQLAGSGRYLLPNDHSVLLEAEGRFFDDRASLLRASLRYSVPFDLPLGRLSNVGEVRGVFRDASGAGLAGLIVQLDGFSTVTQADGSFYLPAVPEGLHYLSLRPGSLGPDQLTVPATPYRLEVVAGEELALEFQVTGAARLSGQLRFTLPEAGDDAVVFGRGRPEEEVGLVRGVLVELRSEAATLRAVTDEQGRFGFSQLPPGEWQLVVRRGGLPELYRLEPEAQTVRLSPGESAFAEISIVPVARRVQFLEGGVIRSEEDEDDEPAGAP